MTLEKLRELNPNLEIKMITDPAFVSYGRCVNEYDFSDLIHYMEAKTDIPQEGNVYIASVEGLEQFDIKEKLEVEFYGEMPIQIGYVNGRNSTLNGLEYHKGSEINVAITDMVLMLGEVQDISNNKYHSDQVEIFFVPKGTAIEMYGTTLHFSPAKTTQEGFKCIVILPKDTNLPLSKSVKGEGENELLFAKNKWLLAHPERKPLMEKGAYPGIIGENIEILID
ncbi:DUF4867 family protein [Tepidibacillus marianensis]|uniref:DUF4867 family protein n=1 Tax=Tepidibacillus marianensis TaxID=3131995 RepID=UPI0030D61F35